MYFELIGVEHKSGVYEGRDYDNYNLYALEEIENDNGAGYKPTTFKVKSSKTCDIFNVPFNAENIKNAIGKKMNVLFNRYGFPEKIELSVE